MTELVPGEAASEPSGRAGETHPQAESGRGMVHLMLGTLGVVFGDIGTSPLYAMQTVFSVDNGFVAPTPGDVFGVVSLVFWSITLIVSIKYVTFVLRADNDGEGGVMALAARARTVLATAGGRRVSIVLVLGVLGASLFYGDSVITPAISVLSAVQGIEVAAPGFADAVVPVSAVVLAVLFAVQRWGTQRVGSFFGPVMLVWFAVLAAVGLHEVVARPGILLGLSPTYAIAFFAAHPLVAFVAMGAVLLAITGAEALYADMGHFGRPPIRRTWFFLVFPALTLNYLAQGALILDDPGARDNPFFLLLPGWAQLPMVVLATAATVIASQAVITGAFSVSRQAVRLGFLPHLRIRHTSEQAMGQIYVPAVNAVLFVAVLTLVFAFGSATSLANAYGVAVTGTFVITTSLFLVIAHRAWHWAPWQLALTALVFGGVELTFFAASLTKVRNGGWLTLLIAAAVFTIMVTWRRGRDIVTARRRELEGTLPDFIADLHEQQVLRVPGTAVFPHPTKETTPLALRANVEHNHVLHERVVIISVRTAGVPHVPWSRRLTIDHLGDPADRIVHIDAEFGFQDRTDLPEVLRRASAPELEGPAEPIDPETVSYFVSRIALQPTHNPGMSTWRKHLFVALAHNAATPTESFCLPDERTIVVGAHVGV